MAGLARLTLVVEAADPSGSLITAEFARDLGRAVAAVPGRVTARMAAGHQRPAARRRRAGHLDRGRARRALRRRHAARAARRARAAAAGRRRACRDVLDAVEAGAGVDEIVAAHRFLGRRGARRPGPTRGGGARRARRARRLGASRHVRRCAAHIPADRAAAPILPAPMVPDAHTPPRLLSIAGLGLRRRRGHPGRPEGVRRLRRPRDDRDHGDHRPEHRGRDRGLPAAARGDRRAGAGGGRGHRRRRGEDRHGRDRRGDRGRGRARSTCSRRTCRSCSTR